jgi:hypothetical protein
MLDPATITVTATAIATLIAKKALEKGGEKLGEAASQKIGELLTAIRQKFATEGVEGKLAKVQEEPSEKNQSRLEQELVQQMEDDKGFAAKLQELMAELKSNDQVNQIFFKGVSVKGDAEVGGIEQTATRGGSTTQEAVTDVDVGGVGQRMPVGVTRTTQYPGTLFHYSMVSKARLVMSPASQKFQLRKIAPFQNIYKPFSTMCKFKAIQQRGDGEK